MKDVIERVELIVSVQGSRRISRENLQFMFDKYELTQEEQQGVLDYCMENRIVVFCELPPETPDDKGGEESSTASNREASVPKKSFFARLFGR